MKIFLFNPEPPYFKRGLVMRRNRLFPPITLAIIAQGLERSGHDILLQDANALGLKNRDILKELRRFRPDLLIYSTDRHDAWQLPVPSHGYIEAFFEGLGGNGLEAMETLLIGPHGTMFPDLLLQQVPRAHFLVRGEPEEKTLEFVKALERGEPCDAGGISFRQGNGTIRHNPDPGFIEDLDALPLPAYHLLPMERYQDNTAPGLGFGLIITSRGCPMSCIFCSKSMYGSKFRTRSIERVLEELDLLVRRYGVKRVFFHDQILLFERDRIEELLLAMLDRRYLLSWRCQTRLFTLDEEILKLMRRAGCTEVHVGLASASAQVISAMKKTDADIDRFAALHDFGKSIGISISPNMIIGLPNETYASVMESARFYHERGFPFLPNVAIPYPDTRLYEIGVKEGKIKGHDWDTVVDAAGRPGNTLTPAEYEKIFREVHDLNTRLRRSRLTFKEKALKAPGYLAKKVLSKMGIRR